MKQLYKYIAIFFVGLVAFSSCADENEFPNTGTKGDDVSLQLSFQPQTNKEVINSRATAADENKLYDLHFYVFNAQGQLTGYEKLVSETGEITTPGPVNVNIRTKTGESYVYAVANINKSITYYLSESDKALLNVTSDVTLTMDDDALTMDDDALKAAVANSSLTRNALLEMKFAREVGSENELVRPDPSNNVFMMSGYLNDGNSVNIQLNGNSATVDVDPIIKLYRILAKNTLTITSSGNAGTFTPKSYRLCNVPEGGILMPKAGISNVASYTADNVTEADVESSFHWNFEGNSTISFYYPENLQTVKEGMTCTEWKDRETNEWSSGSKVYTHAANEAAYIEIYGDYVNSTGKVTANVTYTIHFGDFSNPDNMNNFNVIRNHAYTYTVTVSGVDDIRVEATTTSDSEDSNDVENPYAEGLIVDASGGSHYDVDAHYEARVLTFNKESIQNLKAANNNAGTGYILNVNTPFGATSQTVNVRADGVYSMTGDKLCTIAEASNVFTGEADYLWMKFVKNTNANRTNTSNSISTHTCKFPGDQWDKSTFDKSTDTDKPDQPWMNVFELLAELYNDEDETYTENGNTEVYYTCFIDEYYYYNKSWPDYVDKDPRTMLIANDLAVSEDGKSLYAEVAYSISQRSISTFYVTDYKYPDGTDDLVKAFGTEIIDEEDEYENRLRNNYGNISSADDWNAWSSAYATNDNGYWYQTNVVNKSGIQPLYSKVAKACMSRNRDLDGNGRISQNEVRWYLAAVEQYRALFYGRNALDQDSYLITTDDLQTIDDNVNQEEAYSYRGNYHYYTSSSNAKVVFWPEEGLSTGHNGYGYSYADLVRCIRTLDSGTEQQSAYGLQNPEKFYTYSDNVFSLDGIKATRGNTNLPLVYHNEIDPTNNLSASFMVAKNNHSQVSLGQLTGASQNAYNTDPCLEYQEGNYGKGTWRSPNQKELALMVSEIQTIESGDYASKTMFTGNDPYDWYYNGGTSRGFWSDAGRVTVEPPSGNLSLRCVRDVPVSDQ